MLASLKEFAPLILYVLGIIAFIVAISGRVQYALLFLIPLFPLQNVVEKLDGFFLGKDINDVLLLAMLMGWLVSKASGKEKVLTPTSFNIVFLLYLFYTYFTLWMGSFFLHEPAPISVLDPRVQNWKNYMVLPLLFFVTANNLKDEKGIKQLFIVMCFTMILMGYYNVQQVFDMTSWISRAKVTGTFVYLGANEVAAFYATYTFLLIAVFFMDKKDWKLRILLAGVIVMNLFCNLFMYSRGAYIATLTAFLFFAVVRKKILILPIVFLLLSWQTILPQKVVDRIKFTENSGELDTSAQTRLVLWQQSMIYFKENPVFGVGFNVFSKIGMQRDTHNVFLRTLAEQGLIGFLFLMSILLIAFRKGWQLYNAAGTPFLKALGLGFAACVIATAVANLFGDRWTPLPLAAFFWVYLGMVERGIVIATASKTNSFEEKNKGKNKRKSKSPYNRPDFNSLNPNSEYGK